MTGVSRPRHQDRVDKREYAAATCLSQNASAGRVTQVYAHSQIRSLFRVILVFLWLRLRNLRKVKEEKHLFSPVAKWFYITTDSLWHKGLCNCDTSQTWEGPMALVVRFPLCHLRTGRSTSSSWHNHRVRHWAKQLGMEQKSTFTTVVNSSLSPCTL